MTQTAERSTLETYHEKRRRKDVWDLIRFHHRLALNHRQIAREHAAKVRDLLPTESIAEEGAGGSE